MTTPLIVATAHTTTKLSFVFLAIDNYFRTWLHRKRFAGITWLTSPSSNYYLEIRGDYVFLPKTPNSTTFANVSTADWTRVATSATEAAAEYKKTTCVSQIPANVDEMCVV